MQSRPVLREPRLQGMFGWEWLDQLQVRIAQVQVRKANSAVIDVFTVKDGKSELVAPEFERGVGVGHDDGDVVEPTKTGEIANWGLGGIANWGLLIANC